MSHYLPSEGMAAIPLVPMRGMTMAYESFASYSRGP